MPGVLITSIRQDGNRSDRYQILSIMFPITVKSNSGIIPFCLFIHLLKAKQCIYSYFLLFYVLSVEQVLKVFISFNSRKFIRSARPSTNMSSAYSNSEASPQATYNRWEYVSPSSQGNPGVAMVQNVIIERAPQLRIPKVDYHEGDSNVQATNVTIECATHHST